jgi:membrane-associated phospholipid phosphatase
MTIIVPDNTWMKTITSSMEGNVSSGSKSWMDYVGMYNPFLSAAISVVYLWKRPTYVVAYLLFVWLNEECSIWLKRQIREPRPQLYVEDPDHRGYYGMPSGHAQNAAFTVTYLWLVQPSWMMTCVIVLLGMISLTERYKNGRHTITQLVVGCVIGGVFAAASVYLVRKALEGGDFR